jgi:O-antigen ligase/tetratricopeptide (TPR) repeat protein
MNRITRIVTSLYKIITDFKISMDEVFFLLLLLFTPVAHGTVEVWSVTVMHIMVILIATLSLFRLLNRGSIKICYSWFDLLILIFLISSISSIFYSSYPYATRMFVYKLISYILIYYYLFYLLRNNRIKLKRLIAVLVIFGSMYATAALTIGGGHFLGLKVFSANHNNISLFFANRNHFAGYIEMILMLSIAFFMIRYGPKRGLFQILSVYIGIAIFFSMSRGGIIGMLSGLAFLTIILAVHNVQRRNIWLIVSFLILIIGITSYLGIEPVLDRLGTLENPQLAGKGRLEYWQGTMRLIKDNGWFGTGPGTFIYTFPRYQSEYCANFIVSHAHNDYLEYMAEGGITGFLFLSLLLFLFFTKTIKKLINLENRELQIIGFCALAACISLIFHSFFEFNFHIPSNAVLFVVCAAITVSISSSTDTKMKYFSLSLNHNRKIKYLIGVVFIILVISYTYFIIAPYIGEKYYYIAREYQKQKKYDLAIIALKKSLSIDKGNSEYMAAMGDFMMTRSLSSRADSGGNEFLVSALKYYNMAIRSCRVQSYYYTKKFICLNRLKKYNQAVAALKKAIHYSPMSPYNYYYLGDFYLGNNRIAEACKEYSRYFGLTDRGFELTLDKIIQAGHDYDVLKSVLSNDIILKKRFVKYLFSKGKNKEAIGELEGIYSVEPNVQNALAHLNGVCKTKEYQRALIEGENYLSIYKDGVLLQKQVATICCKLNMVNEAKEIYDKLLIKAPYHADIYIDCANLYARLDDYKKGIEILSRGIMYNPNIARLHYILSIFYKKYNQPENSLNHLKKSVFIAPDNITYRFLLAQEYKNKGLFQQAVEQWNKCLEIKPEEKKTVQALSELYHDLGMIDSEYCKVNDYNANVKQITN